MRFWRVRFRALRARAVSALRRGKDCRPFLRQRRSGSAMVTPAIPASAECPAGGAPGERSQNSQYRSCQQGYGVAVEAWRRDHELQHVVPAMFFQRLLKANRVCQSSSARTNARSLPSGEREGCPQLTPSQLLTSIGVLLPFFRKTSVQDSVPAIPDFVCWLMYTLVSP
jgi:hypothetical protein